MSKKIVIAGAGHAAGQVVATLRQQNFEGQIVLIGDEPYLPYQRPPLSKKFLAGELSAERLHLKAESFYDAPNIDLRLQTTVTSINRDTRTLGIEDGDDVPYEKLVLALGSRAKELRVEGADLNGVYYLRSIEDVEQIRREMDVGRHLVIIGAGYIGLEVAAVARGLGLDVTVIEAADRVMSRVVSPEISDFYQIEHTSKGVKLKLSSGVAALRGKKRVKLVETSAGEELRADFVIVAIGIVPNTELAEQAGLEVSDGIVVDDQCLTSDGDIYAVGDCTSHPSDIYGRQLRLESVHNAIEQAKTAAYNLCGIETHYSEVPWFWSDQYDLKLQIAGLSEGYEDVVIRGNPAERSFACLYLKDSRLIAVDAVNAPKDYVHAKALIAARTILSSDRLADATTSLKDIAAGA
ncbi:MAG: FAD-dependent oxidoreductase [Gammaproteobacteria bacterium]|nr:FAD-dependent oxidoreductase [Gammaproteobacteria bacterium]MDH3362803.1 FAD-dependent oxidoreductase [Gammaproteobacteria bacterium]MDH3480522.1 FAD-dependent oxidoreductase [Gammaproteobacteria bacterium]